MAEILNACDVARMLPPRPAAGHKGTFGHLLVLAGSRGFTGAAVLVCDAANRAGAGLVTAGVPESLADIVAASLREPMSLPLPGTDTESLSCEGLEAILAFARDKSAMVLGPGLSQHPSTALLSRKLMALRPLPMVADADALNAWRDCRGRLAVRAEDVNAEVVYTPHPGEMARLTGLAVAAVQQEREPIAVRHAALWRAVVVLKGQSTVIAAPDGRARICPTGNNGLGTGGAGDVLSGIIGALLAQGAPAFEAACIGVYVHGLAGDLAAARLTPRGMIASDVIAALPGAWRELERATDDYT